MKARKRSVRQIVDLEVGEHYLKLNEMKARLCTEEDRAYVADAIDRFRAKHGRSPSLLSKNPNEYVHAGMLFILGHRRISVTNVERAIREELEKKASRKKNIA